MVTSFNSSGSLAPFRPVEAGIGGVLIGTGAGVFMLLSRRIAGNSGVMKALVVGPRNAKVAYILGLLVAGVSMRLAEPTLFDAPTPPTSASALFGLVIGVGTTLGNGCTSGHGLCGLSRLSIRSLVAVPVFMVAAIVASTLATFFRTNQFTVSLPAPPAPIQAHTLQVSAAAVGVLGLTFAPVMWAHRLAVKESRESPLVAAWCGLCAGSGLAIGGMVRPSVIQAALAPQRVDFSLWVLFTVALATTFTFYRIAHRAFGIAEAYVAQGKQGRIDRKLLIGAALFGLGWGASGLCPGPLIVLAAAQPTDVNAVLCLLGVIIGILVADAPEVLRVLENKACTKVRPSAQGHVGTSSKGQAQATPAA